MSDQNDSGSEKAQRAQRKAQLAAARALVAGLPTPRAHAAFAYLALARLNAVIATTRGRVPGFNVVDEALALAAAHLGGSPYDAQRLDDLVSTRPGHGITLLFLDPDAKAVGVVVDLVQRSLVRPDQAAECAARAAGLLIAVARVHYQDGEAAARNEEEALRAHVDLVIRAGNTALDARLLGFVPPVPAGAPAAHARVAASPGFGPSAEHYSGPEWENPFDDDDLTTAPRPRPRTADVEVISLKVSLKCPACQLPFSVNEIGAELQCWSCHARYPADEDLWHYLAANQMVRARHEMAAGQTDSSIDFGKVFVTRLEYGRTAPACSGCGGALDAAQVLGAVASGSSLACPGCARPVRARRADALVQAIDPSATFILGETMAAEPSDRARGIAAPCACCGAPLRVDGSTRLVPCTWCMQQSYLPDALWMELHSVPRRQWLYLISDVRS